MNDNSLAVRDDNSKLMEQVIANGDLSKLSAHDRNKYYHAVCQSVGLNPLTRPFEYIRLNGKLTLYARKDATDQLRKVYGVSVTSVEQSEVNGVMIMTVSAKDKEGREDTDIGAVYIGNSKGDSLANAIMKAITKGKRRVTLSLCGLGMLDETEIETIPANKVQHVPAVIDTPVVEDVTPAPPESGGGAEWKHLPQEQQEFYNVPQVNEAPAFEPTIGTKSPLYKRFHAVGVEVYGDEWDDKRAEFCTYYEVNSSKELTVKQVQSLLDGMEKKKQ